MQIMQSSKESKYLFYGFKKSTNLGKMHFLTKIHNQIDNVSGSPVRWKFSSFSPSPPLMNIRHSELKHMLKILVIF